MHKILRGSQLNQSSYCMLKSVTREIISVLGAVFHSMLPRNWLLKIVTFTTLLWVLSWVDRAKVDQGRKNFSFSGGVSLPVPLQSALENLYVRTAMAVHSEKEKCRGDLGLYCLPAFPALVKIAGQNCSYDCCHWNNCSRNAVFLFLTVHPPIPFPYSLYLI